MLPIQNAPTATAAVQASVGARIHGRILRGADPIDLAGAVASDRPCKSKREVPGRDEAFLRVLFETVADDPLEPGRQPGAVWVTSGGSSRRIVGGRTPRGLSPGTDSGPAEGGSCSRNRRTATHRRRKRLGRRPSCRP